MKVVRGASYAFLSLALILIGVALVLMFLMPEDTRRVSDSFSRALQVLEWCDFEVVGKLCSTLSFRCTLDSPTCKWFPPNAPAAVIFSDRLVETGMVTMTSLCRHPAHLHVLVVQEFRSTSHPVPSSFLNCTVITMQLNHALDYLRKHGFSPDAICDGPGRSDLGQVQHETLIRALDWDKDSKHASCSNHLRFYLPEFPIFARNERVLFVDDDVVIQHDAAVLYNQPVKPGTIFTANCDVNLWSNECQRFGVGRANYSSFFKQATYASGAWADVLELLRVKSGGVLKYDNNHFQWNFGFNLVHLGEFRKSNLTRIYQEVASQLLVLKYLRADSLMYGLGVPFLVFSGHVQCYERSGWFVVDGLGYVPPAEMQAAGYSMPVLRQAAVLHFNGGRKPWGKHAFKEYLDVMGDWGQNAEAVAIATGHSRIFFQTPVKLEAKPLQLLVILSGPRTGTEWLAKVLSDDEQMFCGSIEDRSAPHPEALIPFDVVCKNRSQVPCRAWEIVRPTNDSCDLRRLCLWRYVIATARGSLTDITNEASYVKQWRAWGKDRNASSIFEGYLRRMMQLPTTAPELPCRCESGQQVLVLKFFLGWLSGKAREGLKFRDDVPFLRRFVLDFNETTKDEVWHLVDILPIFKRLQAKVIFLHRDPITQYVSIQRARMLELKGSSAAWHCFDESSCKNASVNRGLLKVDTRDAAFFILEAERLKKSASPFRPIVSWTFEDCVADANKCIDNIYGALGLQRGSVKIIQARVSSLLSGIENGEQLKSILAAIRAGNWSISNRSNQRKLSNGTPGTRATDDDEDLRNMSIEDAVSVMKNRLEGVVETGRIRCPRVRALRQPLYKLFAQIHHKRLVRMLVNPELLEMLSLICVIGSEPVPSNATLPEILSHLRRAHNGSNPFRVVLYSDPRGSNHQGFDKCPSYQELERSAKAGVGAMSWNGAGTLDSFIDAHATTLYLQPPKSFVAGNDGRAESIPPCVLVGSHPLADSGRSGSTCLVNSTECPPTELSEGQHNIFIFSSLIRVGPEIMTVLDARVVILQNVNDKVCRLIVSRDPGSAQRHSAGTHVLAPTHLDIPASETTCASPVKYALDYFHQTAANCIEAHVEQALAVGADGTWLDNMGPKVSGARTSRGFAISSYDLRYPTDESPEPCYHQLDDLQKVRSPNASNSHQIIKLFKECRLSTMIKVQGRHVRSTVKILAQKHGLRPLVYADGLEHAFYWSDSEMNAVTELYLKVQKSFMQSKPLSQARGFDAKVHEMRLRRANEKRDQFHEPPEPFWQDRNQSILYYQVKGTPELMTGDYSFDGFNMESFFGSIQVSERCASWPVGRNVSLQSCGAKLEHPGPDLWHANARVLAHAGRHGLRALAKIGQSGWTTVAQEYLPPASLHGWVLAAYASFLMVAPNSGPNSPFMLGVHPFSRLPNGSSLQPWLHPVFMIDIGQPSQTEELLEGYRVSEHSTYARHFDHGIALYNPYPDVDHAVPLGGEFVDPWDDQCHLVSTWTLEGQSGIVLFKTDGN